MQEAIKRAIGIELHGSATWTDEQWAEHDAAVAVCRSADAQEQLAAKLRQAVEELTDRDGWPRRAIDVALEADLAAPAIVKLRELDMTDRNIVVISGSAGSGKTVGVAWWALQRKTTAKLSTKFVRASTFAAASRYDREERNVWLKASALVLDDAGAEYNDAKGSLTVDLDELIDTFYGDRRPLLITTNGSVVEFKKRYGERITDRLRECGRWVSIDGGSLRGKPPKGRP